MKPIQLNPSWSRLMHKYREDHSNPVNQACHAIGVPLIAASLPIGATIVGLPLAAGMFTLGWTFQFVGHAFEGKKPTFLGDRRATVIGLLWFLNKTGLVRVETTAEPAAAPEREPKRHASSARPAPSAPPPMA
jgi:uncharacterized membrane protein YGL010W